MKLSQAGAQLYTARDHLKNPAAFAHTIDRLPSKARVTVENSALGTSFNCGPLLVRPD
jgi:hypothetical protein